MTDASWIQRQPWTLPVAAAVLASASRAAMLAARDEYARAGLYAIALRSASGDFLEVLGPVALGAVAIGLAFGRGRGRPLIRLAAATATAVIAYFVISGRLPVDPLDPPGFGRLSAKVGHAAAGLAAMAITALLLYGFRFRARVVRAAVVAAALVAAGAAGTQALSMGRAATQPFGGRPNVILISLDAVRADHLGSYGYSHLTTPEIDRFFSGHATRFEAAFAPQPWTLPSHMTMLTSLPPSVHGVNKDRALPRGLPTLAQLLVREGYVTVGHVYDGTWIHERYGFDRGFHIYRRFGGSAASRKAHVNALLDDLEGKRFFLFLHYYDAHSDTRKLPYESEPEDRAAFAGWYRGPFDGCDESGTCATDLLATMSKRGITFPDAERRYLISLYDAGLRGLDRELGKLFRGLEDRGLLHTTIVVLTADHGEEFQEHGKFLHFQPYDELLRVPLLVRLPGPGQSRVSHRLVSLEDIAPTLLDYCGLERPTEMQGRSLRSLIAGDEEGFGRSHVLVMDESGHAGLRTEGWKLVTTANGFELYDLVRDPGERRNRMSDERPPPEAGDLRRLLQEELQKAIDLRTRLGASDAESPTLTPSEIESLRALGYVAK